MTKQTTPKAAVLSLAATILVSLCRYRRRNQLIATLKVRYILPDPPPELRTSSAHSHFTYSLMILQQIHFCCDAARHHGQQADSSFSCQSNSSGHISRKPGSGEAVSNLARWRFCHCSCSALLARADISKKNKRRRA